MYIARGGGATSGISGLSLMDMVALTDVVITFTSDSLVPILGSRIDVPLVRVLPDIHKSAGAANDNSRSFHFAAALNRSRVGCMR